MDAFNPGALNRNQKNAFGPALKPAFLVGKCSLILACEFVILHVGLQFAFGQNSKESHDLPCLQKAGIPNNHKLGMNSTMKTCKCFSCGGEYPDIGGPVHRYMKSSSGCWAVYGSVLAREYSNLAYFEVHRLTVDAYAVQHPGSTDRQSIQSVGVHLIRLCLFLEHGLTAQNANNAMLEAGKYKHTFKWLEPPASLGAITAADVVETKNVEEHKSIVRAWARSSWDAWSKHHDTIRAWLPAQQVVPADAKKWRGRA